MSRGYSRILMGDKSIPPRQEAVDIDVSVVSVVLLDDLNTSDTTKTAFGKHAKLVEDCHGYAHFVAKLQDERSLVCLDLKSPFSSVG